MPLLAEGQGHWRESNPGKGTKYVSRSREGQSVVHPAERSPDGDGKRGIRRRCLSPSDCNEMGRQREREREEDGEPSEELGEKLMKNIEIRRRKEARELKRRRGSWSKEDSQVAERRERTRRKNERSVRDCEGKRGTTPMSSR